MANDNTVEILFKTVAELNAAKEFSVALEKNIADAKKAGLAVQALSQQHKELAEAIEKSEKALQTQSAQQASDKQREEILAAAESFSKKAQAAQEAVEAEKQEEILAKAAAQSAADQEKAWAMQSARIVDMAGKTDQLSISKKNLIGNIKALAHEIPGLSSVLAVVKNPMVAVGVSIGIVVDAVKSYFAKINEAVEQQNLAEAVRKQVLSITQIREELAASSTDFAAKLNETANKGRTAADEFRKYADELQRILDLQEKLTDAELARDKAQIKLQLAKKEITSQQAREMEEAAEQRSGVRKEEAQKRADQSKADNLRWTIAKTERELEEAKKGLPTKDERAQAKVDADIFATQATGAEKEFGEKEKEIRKRLTDVRAARQSGGRIDVGYKGYQNIPGATTKGISYDDAEKYLEHELDLVQRGRDATRLDAAKSKLAADDVEKRNSQAQERILAATARLAELKAQLATTLEQGKQEAGLKAQIKEAQQAAQSAESQTKTIDAAGKRDKEIEEKTKTWQKQVIDAGLKGEPMPAKPQDLIDLENEKAADKARADSAAAPPRPPNISPPFRAVAEAQGFYIDPAKNALENNSAQLQNLAALLVTYLKRDSQTLDQALAEIRRRLDQLNTRAQYGPNDL